MNKNTLIILLSILVISCDFKKKAPITSTKITKEFLSGKEFTADAKMLMGSKHFEFIDTDKVSYYIRDKTAYGYNGTYTFEYDNRGSQFIKINEEKDNLTVLLFVKSPTKLEIVKVNPEIYKTTVSPFFDVVHQIGKVYKFKTTKTE